MPRNKRGDLKLKHDQAANHVETAAAYMTELYEMFLPAHPKYAEGYKNICIMLAQVHEFILEMKKHI